MVIFKVISGYYKNLTYNTDFTYHFSKDKIKQEDIRLVGDSSSTQHSLVYSYLKSNVDFRAKHIGLSRIEGVPMFMITLAELRDDKIDKLLS